MADTFAKFNSSTHPIVKLEDDWNNLLDHGLHNFTGYYILTDGTYYSAINASTHKLIYGGENDAGGISGTDFDAVWTAVLSAIGDYGIVKLGSGVFYTDGLNIINSGIVTDNTRQWIEICGEGQGNTIIRGNTDAVGASSNDGAFTDKAWLMLDSYNTSGIRVHLHDFQIDGVKDSQTNLVQGTILRYGRDALIERVFVQQCSTNGIQVVGPNLAYRPIVLRDNYVFNINDPDDVPAAPRLDNCVGINLTVGVADVFVYSNYVGWVGIEDIGDDTKWHGAGIGVGDSCVIEGNVIWAAETGIETYSGTQDQMINNNFVDFTGDAGILLTENNSTQCHNNIIRIPYQYGIYLASSTKCSVQGNKFVLRPTYSATSFIQEDGTSDYNDIKNNNFEHDGTVTWTAANPVGDHTLIMNNKNCNPKGVVGTPFLAANTSISWIGDTATPTASTDYTIMHSDCIITSTDSGNSNCAILIKTPAGVAINSVTYSVLDGWYVPVGFKVNWGAFTGAAPTVKTLFL